MGINIRTKGQGGEREIQKILNDIISHVRVELKLPAHATIDLPFQRNQNQSAVGGSDLSNPFGIEIEVKRQEALSLNSWWKQCILSAARTGGIPILIYKQNYKPWKVMMKGHIPIQRGISLYRVEMQVEISITSFKAWFTAYYKDWIANG